MKLKLEMKAELHLAHGNLNVRDLTGSRGVDCGVGQAQINVIEGIEGIGAKLKRAALASQQVL